MNEKDDFPFYNGKPIELSNGQWLSIFVAVAIGFTCISVPVPVLTGPVGLFVRTLLFPLLPLIALYLVAGRFWTCIFRRVQKMDFVWMFTFALLNLIVSSLVGFIVLKLLGAEVNAAVGGLAEAGNTDRILFYLRTIPQLFGEEVLTILPFLGTMYFAHSKLGLSRKKSIFAAWFISSIIFGLIHLPSYNWNLIQCILVIGTARLVLSLAYIKTKNIWVSTGAHIINDWSIFSFVIFASSLSTQG